MPAPIRCLTEALLLERPPTACRLGLPVDGAAVRAWLNPLAVWGARLRAVAEGRGNAWARGRARRNG